MGGMNRGMEVEREKIRDVEQWWRGNRLSCSPGKGDLFVSVGLCYSPDVSIIGPWRRETRQHNAAAHSNRGSRARLSSIPSHNFREFTQISVNELKCTIYFLSLVFNQCDLNKKEKCKETSKLFGQIFLLHFWATFYCLEYCFSHVSGATLDGNVSLTLSLA